MTKVLIALALGCSALMACGSKDDSAADSADVAAAPGDEAGASASGGISADVTLTGGKYPGTYKGERGSIPCIDYGALGLGGQYSRAIEDTTSKLGRADFGTKSKSATPTDDFAMSVYISSPRMDGDFAIDPKKGNGTGTAKVTGTAPNYVVAISGKTADGVGVEATFRCLQ